MSAMSSEMESGGLYAMYQPLVTQGTSVESPSVQLDGSVAVGQSVRSVGQSVRSVDPCQKINLLIKPASTILLGWPKR